MPSRCEDVHQVLSQKVKEIGKIIKFFAGEYCKSWKRFSIGAIERWGNAIYCIIETAEVAK